MAKFSGFISANKKPTSVQYLNVSELRNTMTAASVGERRYTYTGDERNTFSLNKRIELGFKDMSLLMDDWDSYNAKAPTATTIEVAKEVSTAFPPKIQPEIYPENDGSIGLYWDFDDATFCMKIVDESNFSWFIEDPSGNQMTSKGSAITEVASAIRNHIEKILKKNNQY